MDDLQRWSDDKVSIKRRTPLPANLQIKIKSPPQQAWGAKTRRAIDIIKDELNVRYQGVHAPVDKSTKKTLEQTARKTVQIATKVKYPKTFEQKYKTVDGKTLT